MEKGKLFHVTAHEVTYIVIKKTPRPYLASPFPNNHIFRAKRRGKPVLFNPKEAHIEGDDVKLRSFLTLELDRCGWSTSILAELFPRKQPRYPSNMRPGCLQNMYGRFGKERHFYSTRHLNPGQSRRQIIAVATSPFQLSLFSCFYTQFLYIIFCESYD